MSEGRKQHKQELNFHNVIHILLNTICCRRVCIKTASCRCTVVFMQCDKVLKCRACIIKVIIVISEGLQLVCCVIKSISNNIERVFCQMKAKVINLHFWHRLYAILQLCMNQLIQSGYLLAQDIVIGKIL